MTRADQPQETDQTTALSPKAEPVALIHQLHPKGANTGEIKVAQNDTSDAYRDAMTDWLRGGADTRARTRAIEPGRATDAVQAGPAAKPEPGTDFGMVAPAMFTAALMAGKLTPPADAKYSTPEQKYLASVFGQTATDLKAKVFSPDDLRSLATTGETSDGVLKAKAAKGTAAAGEINTFLERNGIKPMAKPVSKDGVIVAAVASIDQSWDGRGKPVDPIKLGDKSFDAYALKGVAKFTGSDGVPVYRLSDANGDAVYVAPHPTAFADGAEFSQFVASHTPAGQRGEITSLRLPDVDSTHTVNLASLQGMPIGDGYTMSYAFLQNKLAMNEYGMAMKTGFVGGAERSIRVAPDYDETMDKSFAIWRVKNGVTVQQDYITPTDWKVPPKDAIKH